MGVDNKDSMQSIDSVQGTVKWFDRDRGFGFAVLDPQGGDCFLHARILEPGTTLSQGDRVSLTVAGEGQRVQALTVKILQRASVGPGSDGASHFNGTVRFYSRERGYGFAETEDGRQVFLGGKVLRRLGIDRLRASQEIMLTAVEGPSGLVAQTVRVSRG